MVHLTILDQNGAETDFRGPKVTPIGAGWTKKMKHYVWDTWTSNFGSGHKKLNGLAGGSGRVNIYSRNGLNLASEPSRGPQLGQGQLDWTPNVSPNCPWLVWVNSRQSQALEAKPRLGKVCWGCFWLKMRPNFNWMEVAHFHFAWLVPHLNHFLYMPACQKRPETLKNCCCWLLLAQNAKFQPNLGFSGVESQKIQPC